MDCIFVYLFFDCLYSFNSIFNRETRPLRFSLLWVTWLILLFLYFRKVYLSLTTYYAYDPIYCNAYNIWFCIQTFPCFWYYYRLLFCTEILSSISHGGGGLVAKLCLTFAIPWTVAHQAPQSMGFSRQEYFSGLPFPSPGDLPDPGIEPRSPAL